MAYQSWSVVFGEQPSAAKWNILGTNDAYFSSLLDANGMPLQVASTNYSAVDTTTTAFPVDDTIPQNGEGKEFMSQAITPKSATNKLVIEAKLFVSNNQAIGNTFGAGLFQDSVASAIAAAGGSSIASGALQELNLRHVMTAGTTSSTTFKVRAGNNSGGTLTFNGSASARAFGGITLSNIRVSEYKA